MLDEHLAYVADAVRLERFRAAIAQVVKPGDVVADLGCGSGVLGLLCLQAGAAKVYAVDHSAMIDVARRSLERSEWGDRAVFVRGNSMQVDLPERVDVVICDHVGYFGFDYDITQVLGDARKRLLEPPGAVIPARIKLHVAAVESAKCLERAEGWAADAVPAEFHWLRECAVNAKHRVRLERDELLSGPAELGTIDLREDNAEFFSFSAQIQIERAGSVHGLGGWFECELAEGVWMTNSPLDERPIDRPQVFLPLGEAIEVNAGDVVEAKLRARPPDHLLAWEVHFPSTGRRFSRSTWEGEIGSRHDFMRRTPGHVPRLSRKGQAKTIVLGYCDGSQTVGQIEAAVLKDHPDLLPSRGEICRFVTQVLATDAE